MKDRRFAYSSQRGAVMVHVALGMMVFLGFTAYSVDYGVKWVSRAQAQNAADAGALAGATALMLDSDDRTDAGVAKKSARSLALANGVWGEAPDVQMTDITFPPCPPPDGDDPLGAGPFNCIRVDVYRNVSRNNPLPTLFARLLGVQTQGVRAMAVAKLGEGNSIKCLLPFGVGDRWADYHDIFIPPSGNSQYFPNDGLGTAPGSTLQQAIDGWTMNDNYEGPQGDVYRSPLQYTDGTHTGWTTAPMAQGGDYGRQLVLKFGATGALSSGWANKVELPGSGQSASAYEADISGCNENPISIAAVDEDCEWASNHTTPEEGLQGCVGAATGVSQGPTVQGVNALRALDNVYWNRAANGGEGAVWETGCTPSASDNCIRNETSPRVRPLVVFDINHYVAQGCSGTGCVTKVGNIIGFFIEGMCNNVISGNGLDPGTVCQDPNKDVVGRIVTLPGQYFAGGGNVSDDAAFLKFVTLVR